MYIFKYVCMYICIYVYMYICIYVYMYICIFVYMYICIFVYLYLCIYVYMFKCICKCICMYIYIYVSIWSIFLQFFWGICLGLVWSLDLLRFIPGLCQVTMVWFVYTLRKCGMVIATIQWPFNGHSMGCSQSQVSSGLSHMLNLVLSCFNQAQIHF